MGWLSDTACDVSGYTIILYIIEAASSSPVPYCNMYSWKRLPRDISEFGHCVQKAKVELNAMAIIRSPLEIN